MLKNFCLSRKEGKDFFIIFAVNMKASFKSELLDTAVAELGKLPGVGQKTALRLALHLLRRDESEVDALGNALINMRHGVKYCKRCHNISESDVCPLCSDSRRDSTTICVVETVKDVIAVESTRQHQGLYHVLGGVISPLDGIGPAALEIESLVERVRNEGIKEVILALGATMEGDTTSFYIFRKLAGLDVRVTVLARGVSVGSDLEYTDELTLGRSIVNRIPFDTKTEK